MSDEFRRIAEKVLQNYPDIELLPENSGGPYCLDEEGKRIKIEKEWLVFEL